MWFHRRLRSSDTIRHSFATRELIWRDGVRLHGLVCLSTSSGAGGSGDSADSICRIAEIIQFRCGEIVLAGVCAGSQENRRED